jgi:hypothetical protein
MEKYRARRMVAVLIAVHVVLHGIVLSTILRRMVPNLTLSPFDIILYALFMLAPSQGALLAVWIVLGGGRMRWRGLAFISAIIYVWCFSALGINTDDLLTVMLAELGLCTAILLVARCTGLQLVRLSGRSLASGRFQFYIRDMLIWTTALAVALSTWHYLPARMLGWMDRFDACALFASLTLVAGVSMFSTLGRGWIVARIVRLPVIVILAAMLWNLANGGRPQWSWFALLLSLMAFWLVASFLVLRYAGYRLAWRPRLEQPQEQIAA